MQRISRRKFFINSAAMTAGAAAMSTLGARDAAAALKKAVYITTFKYLIGFAPTQNAQVGGHFARHGLDVEILGGTNAPRPSGRFWSDAPISGGGAASTSSASSVTRTRT